MKKFKEYDVVIYTDPHGIKIDTFVVFDTDKATGLTRINHQNLAVSAKDLKPHPCTVRGAHLPFKDAFSFEIFKKLKEKHREAGKINQHQQLTLSKAS